VFFILPGLTRANPRIAPLRRPGWSAVDYDSDANQKHHWQRRLYSSCFDTNSTTELQ